MEFKCEILAKRMSDIVYPKLVEVMLHLNMKDVNVEAKGSKKMSINIDGAIKWFNKDGQESCRVDFKKSPNVCPAMKSYDDISLYTAYCNAIMDKIIDLENRIVEVQSTIDRTGKIGLTYERRVIIEKTLTSHK